jgi:hypothetical protein
MEDLELNETAPATRKRALTIAEILEGTEYALTLFSAKEVAALECSTGTVSLPQAEVELSSRDG